VILVCLHCGWRAERARVNGAVVCPKCGHTSVVDIAEQHEADRQRLAAWLAAAEWEKR